MLFIISVFSDKTASIDKCLQDRVRVVGPVSVTFTY